MTNTGTIAILAASQATKAVVLFVFSFVMQATMLLTDANQTSSATVEM